MRYGQIAQLVEQGIENPRVGSSILSLATTITFACGESDQPDSALFTAEAQQRRSRRAE